MPGLFEAISKFIVVALAAIAFSALFLYFAKCMEQELINTTEPVREVIMNSI